MSQHTMNPCNHDIAAPDTPLVNVQVDGQWIQVPKGMNVVEVAKKAGKFIPHYCYHPKLPISGNCRMCLFEMGTPAMNAERKPIIGADGKPEISWMPRPQIGCATQVTEGMGIRTDSPLAQECRKGVMEFLLINHPLDCPICDQAGECKLQQYSAEYGTGQSRFVEEKVHKPKKVDLGERIVLDDERCVMCSRCIRYAKDVLQDDVLGFVDRGSHTTLTTHPDKKFDNDYSLNTVDICPVGALTSKDFRFQMRVWFLKETKSICTSCGTGCNVTISSRENSVYRLTPRSNEDVNSEWMCDYGRLNFHYLDDERRITQPMSRVKGDLFPTVWPDVIHQVASRIKNFKSGEVGILASGRMTNEELYLTRLLANDLKVSYINIVPRAWAGDRFLKSNDKNPNTTGAALFGVKQEGQGIDALKQGIEAGKIKALIVLHEDAVPAGISAEVLGKLDLLVSVGLLLNETTTKAHFILPGSGFAEKSGSMINTKNRLQRLRRAVLPQGGAKDDWEILRDLRGAITGQKEFATFADLFKSMAASTPVLKDLTFDGIGDTGLTLNVQLSSI